MDFKNSSTCSQKIWGTPYRPRKGQIELCMAKSEMNTYQLTRLDNPTCAIPSSRKALPTHS